MKNFSLIAVLLLSACGNEFEDVDHITLNYWESEGNKTSNEFITNDNPKLINTFLEAVNNAEELEQGKIITTKPLLSFSMMNEDEEKKYHLWVNSLGEGYIQQLHPDENKTFNLDKESVEGLTQYFSDKEDVEIIDQKIEFEK